MSVEFTLVTQITALLTLLALFAAGVQEAVEQLKPYFNLYLPKGEDGEVNPDWYLAALRLSRIVISVLALFIFGGKALLVSVFPWFGQLPPFVPDAAVVILCGLITGLGAGFIHTLLSVIAALVLRITPTEDPAVPNFK